MNRGVVAGKFAIEGTTAVVFVLVVAIYLLHEGRRAYAWLVDFAPKPQRKRFDRTAREVRQVVLSYMRASFITATICAFYVFIVLTLLQLPLVLLLALRIATAYPIVERIWLREHLPPDTVELHNELDEASG